MQTNFMLTDCLLSVVLEEKFRDQYLIKAILRKFHQKSDFIAYRFRDNLAEPTRRKLVPSEACPVFRLDWQTRINQSRSRVNRQQVFNQVRPWQSPRQPNLEYKPKTQGRGDKEGAAAKENTRKHSRKLRRGKREGLIYRRKGAGLRTGEGR